MNKGEIPVTVQRATPNQDSDTNQRAYLNILDTMQYLIVAYACNAAKWLALWLGSEL